MKKKLLAYFLVFAFASTSVLSGSVISYGQNDAEVSDSVNEMEEFSDGSTSELSLSDDMVIPNAGESAYAYSDTATSNGITLKVEWNAPVLGQPTVFHVSAEGGSGNYLFRMDAPSYSDPGVFQYESVADPSRGEWTKYTSACSSHDFTFTMTASGTYNFRFYLMDKNAGVY